MPEAGELTAIVTTHVAPALAGAVVTESTVQLDVEPVLGDDDIEVLGAFATSADLALASG
jgi:hypothetical protein